MNDQPQASKTSTEKNWILNGLKWALFMFLFMALFVDPLVLQKGFSWKSLGIKALVWLFGGLTYGYTMKVYKARIGNKQHTNSN